MTESPSYAGHRTTHSRLSEAAVAGLDELKSTLVPEALLAVHEYDKAHALALMERDIIPRDAARKILASLRELDSGDIAGVRTRVGGGIHSGERYLAETVGAEIGGHLHTGRSAGDLRGVTKRLVSRTHILHMLEQIMRLREALLTLSDRYPGVVMPGYTHGQHAQPVTLALWLGMFGEALSRDVQRLLSFYIRLNESPAGAAIMTGSDFPLDRHRLNELLGFDRPLVNTMDAIQSHDIEIEYCGVLTALGLVMSRLADDLMLWSGVEFSMVELPDRYCGTSSIMPQKKNPDALEQVKLVSAKALSLMVMTAMTERGSTGLTILERHATQTIAWELGTDMATQLERLAGIIADLKVNGARMEELAGANWAQATDIAAMLVHHYGASWRQAHQVVGRFVRQCVADGVSSKQATPAHLESAASHLGLAELKIVPRDFAEAMDPIAFTRRREILGGPGPKAALEARKIAEVRLQEDRKTLETMISRADKARRALQDAIDAAIAA